MRRTPRNLWMTLRGPSSLWTTRSGKGAKESVAASTTDRAFARLRIYNRPRVCASPHLQQTARLRVCARKRTPYGLRPEHLRACDRKRTRGASAGVSPEKGKYLQFDLAGSNRLARHGHQTNRITFEISACRWAFPSRPDGGRKDCKVSRVVEMECASRRFLVTVREGCHT
jgi:hypothetical protein